MANNQNSEFFLLEYQRLSNLIVEENKEVEQRVTFFLTIVSAFIGVLLLFLELSTIDQHTLYTSVIVILTILLAIGFVTQNRLNMRAVQYKVYNKMMSEIQDYFAQQDTNIKKYIAYQRKLLTKPNYQFKFVSFFIERFRGSLSDLVTLINSFLIGGIFLASFMRASYPLKISLFWFACIIVISSVFIKVVSGKLKQYIQPF